MNKRTIRSLTPEVLTSLFIATLIISNIISIKVVTIGSLTFDAGTILFPLAYIIGDIITELYGFRRMRRLVAIGVTMLVLMSGTFFLTSQLSGIDATMDTAFATALGVVPRIAAASIIAIAAGELLNAYVLERLRKRDKGKNLWGRLITSSLAGNAIDTVLFTVIAFAGTMPTADLLTIIVTVFCIKMAVEIIVSPLTVKIVNYLRPIVQTTSK